MRLRTFGNSPSTRREVSRRPPPAKVTWCGSTPISTSASPACALAASVSALAGTSAVVGSCSQVQSSSRMAIRYESVAARVSCSGPTSNRTAVSTGRASSCEAALDRLDVDHAGGEVADHLAEDAAGDHHAAVGRAADQDDRLTGVLEVGGGEPELLVEQLDEGTAQHRQRRPGGDGTAHPGNRVGERVALSRELQG